MVREAGFATTDGSLGVASTGTLNEATLRTMLRHMPDGTWELVCHPGYNDSELAEVRTRLRESREVEMRRPARHYSARVARASTARSWCLSARNAATPACNRQASPQAAAAAAELGRTRERCGSVSPVIPPTAAAEWWPPSLASSWPIADIDIHFISYSQPIRLTEPHPQHPLSRGGSLAVSAL